jgi:hypothetical protein
LIKPRLPAKRLDTSAAVDPGCFPGIATSVPVEETANCGAPENAIVITPFTMGKAVAGGAEAG